MKCLNCPRKCGVDRAEGKRGFCGAGRLPAVARAAAHFWEEPCISGTRGSGTVFFSGCNLRCAFCQNAEISLPRSAGSWTQRALGEVLFAAPPARACNLNLVTRLRLLIR
jgi:putative pyruvate formate lyase activating enzyme